MLSTILLFYLFLSACSENNNFVRVPCNNDFNCKSNEICQLNECIPKDEFLCSNVAEGTPLLQPIPRILDFPLAIDGMNTEKLILHNIGNCTLTIYNIFLKNADQGFTCPECMNSPIDILPLRDFVLDVNFSPTRLDHFYDTLIFVSDDAQFSEIEVPISASYFGTPILHVIPNPIDLGYTPARSQDTKTVFIYNDGNGTKSIKIIDIKLEPQIPEITLEQTFGDPIFLVPYTYDSNSYLSFNIIYSPIDTSDHNTELLITTNYGEEKIPVAGTSQNHCINVSTSHIDFGNIPLGTTQTENLTITNCGTKDISIYHYFSEGDDYSTDFFITPGILTILSGSTESIQVHVTTTEEGDIISRFSIDSENIDNPISITTAAYGDITSGNKVVKIEMDFMNNTNNLVASDLRNVDLSLEDFNGFSCNENIPEPQNWQVGTPSWNSYSIREEPEIILLQNVNGNGVYRYPIYVEYAEDCSSLLTSFFGDIIGLSADIVASIASSGTVDIDGIDISSIIREKCTEHMSTIANVSVSVNGVSLGIRSVSLDEIGSKTNIMTLVYENDNFTIED